MKYTVSNQFFVRADGRPAFAAAVDEKAARRIAVALNLVEGIALEDLEAGNVYVIRKDMNP